MPEALDGRGSDIWHVFTSLEAIAKDPMHIAFAVERKLELHRTPGSYRIRKLIQKFHFQRRILDGPYFRRGQSLRPLISLDDAMSATSPEAAKSRAYVIGTKAYLKTGYRSMNQFVRDIAALEGASENCCSRYAQTRNLGFASPVSFEWSQIPASQSRTRSAVRNYARGSHSS